MEQTTVDLDELRAAALRWITDDPDKNSREEIYHLLDQLPASTNELASRFSGRLRFGTAGLRGPLRAGPNGMNQAVVRSAAAGLANWLNRKEATGPVVIGYDARYRSADFASETARVITGSGREAFLLPEPLPTPVLAYAVRQLGAAAGVTVTASHNPPQDNGYKVYLGEQLGGSRGNGGQIVAPVDSEIEMAIEALDPLGDIPLGDPGIVLDDTIVQSYLADAAAIVDPHDPKQLSIVATPMHGVGGNILSHALVKAGFSAPALVPEQAEPNPDFPTVDFPNPEEPGAMDLLLQLAKDEGADVAISLDPDADRCAVAIPTRDGRWRPLSGNEVGALLADHLMRKGHTGTYATTIVSCTLLKAMCDARGHDYQETLTGFKWIVRAADDLAYGFEEALGYCVSPSMVRDKDGITAALLVAEIAAGLAARMETLQGRLDELADEFGIFLTDQLSVRVENLQDIADCMTRLRERQPNTLLDEPVKEWSDLLPDADVVIMETAHARVVCRPSGTEPKLKAYLEVRESIGSDTADATERARASLQALKTEIENVLGI